jgi:hypothetical protein
MGLIIGPNEQRLGINIVAVVVVGLEIGVAEVRLNFELSVGRSDIFYLIAYQSVSIFQYWYEIDVEM